MGGASLESEQQAGPKDGAALDDSRQNLEDGQEDEQTSKATDLEVGNVVRIVLEAGDRGGDCSGGRPKGCDSGRTRPVGKDGSL